MFLNENGLYQDKFVCATSKGIILIFYDNELIYSEILC